MKTLIPICFAILLLTSCEKTYCWKCDLYSSWSGGIISTTDWCDKTEQEIIAMEQKWRDLGNRYDCVKR